MVFMLIVGGVVVIETIKEVVFVSFLIISFFILISFNSYLLAFHPFSFLFVVIVVVFIIFIIVIVGFSLCAANSPRPLCYFKTKNRFAGTRL